MKNQKQLLKLAKQLERGAIQGIAIQSNKPVKLRNYLALNPLLQKGGIHEKDDIAIARKKQRRQTKRNLQKIDWLQQEY